MRDLRAAGASDLGFVAGVAGGASRGSTGVARANVVKAAQASLPRVVSKRRTVPRTFYFTYLLTELLVLASLVSYRALARFLAAPAASLKRVLRVTEEYPRRHYHCEASRRRSTRTTPRRRSTRPVSGANKYFPKFRIHRGRSARHTLAAPETHRPAATFADESSGLPKYTSAWRRLLLSN